MIDERNLIVLSNLLNRLILEAKKLEQIIPKNNFGHTEYQKKIILNINSDVKKILNKIKEKD
ncbi:hypothetical protein CO154_00535 [Candidatus Pacearchaeota archaeon CG_4_9_14_3_um_filter_31_7]|nr:MAG: hypothetical protein COU55_02325 [Candidatus Pacearchaeota archaeon CG10_big_fil_rev_8_21_14_0_10_31_59]PIZ80125.1 MAG: hypothetical protein COX99_03095 [Candidatus Pacearchaeota archaeon CG_4_10_14_0_2_um_filter_31_10]PJA70895.1 MAG: hypothetical protein CO154_00535 [Candidatus Pacearchaeota archaeon CG_4_9_14_3_um_filter_31_7]